MTNNCYSVPQKWLCFCTRFCRTRTADNGWFLLLWSCRSRNREDHVSDTGTNLWVRDPTDNSCSLHLGPDETSRFPRIRAEANIWEQITSRLSSNSSLNIHRNKLPSRSHTSCSFWRRETRRLACERRRISVEDRAEGRLCAGSGRTRPCGG